MLSLRVVDCGLLMHYLDKMQKLIMLLFLLSAALIISCEKNEGVSGENLEESQALTSANKKEIKLESLQSIKEKVKNRSLPKREYGRENPFALIDIAEGIKNKQTPIRQQPKLHLDGIIWDAKNPLAVIDGKTVGQGDSIGDKIIEKIEKNSVILFDGKKRIKLRL